MPHDIGKTAALFDEKIASPPDDLADGQKGEAAETDSIDNDGLLAPPPGEVRCHLRIFGRVQGVFYRAWTVETATVLKLSGWVRNRLDGSVELVAQGDAGAIERLITACQDGPPSASVAYIDQIDDALSPGDLTPEDAVEPGRFSKRETV